MKIGRFRIRSGGPGFPGPVFGRELGSAAKGRWFYLVRSMAALSVAVGVGAIVRIELASSSSEPDPGVRIAALAGRAFLAFGVAQAVMVLAITPLLVAGSIAGERAKGTLEPLLAVPFGSWAIVADKLMARMLVVLVLMASALPVLALVGLLGGVDPAQLGWMTLATVAAAWSAASLSILVSVHARTAPGAIAGAYLAVLAWAGWPYWFGRWVYELTLAGAGPWWVAAAIRQAGRFGPVSLFYPLEFWPGPPPTPAVYLGRVAEVSARMAALGFVLFSMAAWRLRPAHRATLDARRGRIRGWLARVVGLRGRSRPPCGDDALAWKERHAPESAGLARLVLLVVMLLIARTVAFDLQHNLAHRDHAFDELFQHGLNLGQWGTYGGGRNMMNSVLCQEAAIAYFGALAASAIVAASGVAGERARGTWTSLLGTPIDRRAILRAKMGGAVWAVRWLLGLVVFFYLASLASTAMHPVGFVLGIVAVGSFVGFAVALGAYVSLRSRDANQAIGRTILILAAVDLLPVAALFPFAGPMAFIVSTPRLATELPLSRMRFRMVEMALSPEAWRVDRSGWLILAVPLGIVLAHAVGAWALARAASRRIERGEG